MIQTSNLTILPQEIELFPESIARENCVLPLGREGNILRVVAGRRDDYEDLVHALEFIFAMKVVCAVADFDRVQQAIDEVYTYFVTEVRNCPLEFRFECPRKWLELRPTERHDERFCDTCRKAVHLCQNENEALQHAVQGHCVAVFREYKGESAETMGIMEF